ncbi:hypothetical protein [Kribbella kalugense]|uniref:hypothetical protein n=1 Tax=Kribbella kalugense TaxID=2512221 RepID=UPI001064B449|nr:hypothetical protein [Kribbella kalugense]
MNSSKPPVARAAGWVPFTTYLPFGSRTLAVPLGGGTRSSCPVVRFSSYVEPSAGAPSRPSCLIVRVYRSPASLSTASGVDTAVPAAVATILPEESSGCQ